MRLSPIKTLVSTGSRLKARLGWSGIAIIALSTLSASLLLSFALILWLPSWTEARIRSMLSGYAGPGKVSCEVRRVGLYGADLGALSIGPAEKPSLSFQSCSLDYSPVSLLRMRIRKITLSGFEVNCKLSGGRLSFPGLDVKPDAKRADNGGSENFKIPVRIGLIELKSGTLNLETEGFSASIPFEAAVAAEKSGWSASQLKAALLPAGQRIEVEARLDARLGNLSARISTPKPIQLEPLPCPFRKSLAKAPSGTLSLDAAMTAEEWGRKIKSISATAELEGLSVDSGALSLGSGRGPLKISLSHMDTKGHLEISSAALGGLTETSVEKASLDYALSPDGAEGAFEIALASETQSLSSKIAGSFKATHDKTWLIELSALGEGVKQRDFEMDLKGWRLSSVKPSLQMLASLGGSLECDATAKLPSLKISSGSAAMRAKELTLAARQGKPGTFFDASLDALELSASTLSARLPKISFSATCRDGVFDGAIQSANGVAVESKSGCALEGIEIDVPIRIPSKEAVAGSVSAKAVSVAGKPVGKASAKTAFSSGFLSVDGGASLAPAPGMKIEFSSVNRMTPQGLESKSRLSMPEYRTAAPIDMGAFHPACKDMAFTGTMQFDASFNMTPKGRDGSILLSVSDAAIESPKRGLSMEGGAISFGIPSLPALNSPPSQAVSFKRLTQGKLQFSDGLLLFRMDSPQEWLLEKCSAKWCQGKLRTESIKLSPGSGLDIVLNCDRLNLGDFLTQMGAGKGSGEGAISGTIPLSFEKGCPSFHDGFLHSTPGETSTLKLTDTEALTNGVQLTPELGVQLEFAREASKDFIYSWSRIYLDTKGETFSLKLQMDGKPAGLLPFDLSRDTGYVVKTAEGRKFQGIRLDLNFNIPLSQMLGFSKGLKSLMDKIGNR